MDHIQAMRTFVRIIELGNFSRAAEKLNLPRATVSHTIKRLEARLGVRLLLRTTRQVQVTAEGQIYYQRCLRLLAEIDETDTLFSRQKLRPSGRIRVDMPHSLAREIVIPALPQFYQRYPEITLCLSANDAAIDVLREGVDCVLRAWQVEDESLIARHLPALEQVTCASAAYIERYGMPQTLDDLATHQAVGYFSQRTTRHYPLDFMSQGVCEQRTLHSQIDVSGADVYVAACRAGLGLIQSPRYGVRHWLESGELVEVLPEMPPPDMPLYIMYPAGHFLAPRVSVFIDWLRECFARPL